MKPLLLCFLMLLVSTLVAQQSDPRFQNAAETLSFAAVERIQSEALGEERVLNIYLPQGFHPDSAKSYPVIYVLDGSAHEDFPHIAGLVQFLNMYELVPSSIVVGIANVDRYRDFTFPSEDAKDRESLPTSGGADAFMRFVGEEVLPLIAERYPVNEDRMLIGQSLGGLMATEFLMLQPDLFNR
ncbi:MAG: alpha/beta hydrolase-fold protein, partial [Bacteroidota bacterium]